MRSSETATSMMYIRPSHMLSTWMTRGRCRESPPAVTVMAANRGTPPRRRIYPIHGGRAAGRALLVLGACGRGPVAFHFGLHTGYFIFPMAEY